MRFTFRAEIEMEAGSRDDAFRILARHFHMLSREQEPDTAFTGGMTVDVIPESETA